MNGSVHPLYALPRTRGELHLFSYKCSDCCNVTRAFRLQKFSIISSECKCKFHGHCLAVHVHSFRYATVDRIECFEHPLYRLYIHLVVCLTTGPKPLPKRAVHIVRSRASSFKWQYPLLSLRSSNSFLHLLPCHPVTSIPPCIFPSITRCRRQFIRKMWPIQFGFRLRISCRKANTRK